MKEFVSDIKDLADKYPDIKFHTIAHLSDGEELKEYRTNNGFNPFYLLGLLEKTQLSILNQINKIEKGPDIITKEVIINKDGE